MNVVGRVKAFGAALLSALGGDLRVKPDAVAVGDAPAAWVHYAEQVARRLHSALDGADSAACRLRASLEQRAGATGDNEPLALRLKTWLDARGRIERIECAPRCAPEIEADLHLVAVGKGIGKAPPRGMIQPIVVRLGGHAAMKRSAGS
ncbi:hypothetical protein [Paraburkholderia sp. BL21I4N1]|uniref:hypothetical protein n=1 Tax=Paraburkholderia sp. BL21I4N1 TaxID=1938801 RepID=UPI000CFE0E49|nr:hypothetical protein [Paraburkholderia sp. BL21I4N1]PQV46080.1 hypothetical protein B0G83_11439 [Paraburkholderia sp. BL21I4N1]